MTRALFAQEFGHCFVCFWAGGPHAPGRWGLQTHEIERRSHAHKLREFDRVNLLRACNWCHAGPLATMPHAQQLAYAWLSDPERAASIEDMVSEWLGIRAGQVRPAPDRVTAYEVRAHLSLILESPPIPIIGWALYHRLAQQCRIRDAQDCEEKTRGQA